MADQLPSEQVSARGRQGLAVRFGRMIAGVMVPAVCLACRKPLAGHDALCARCWRDVSFIRAPLCDRLGIPMPFDAGGVMISAAAAADPPRYDRARAVALFGGAMRALVHDFKYADRHEARALFGRWLVGAGADLLADADLIVPVPMHRWRLLVRRYNQAAILAREVALSSGVAFAPQVLVRTRATPPQVGLSRSDRQRNLMGALAVPERALGRVRGLRVLLIDDVITTGTTVEACARVLKAAGAAGVDVLALALVTDESAINP